MLEIGSLAAVCFANILLGIFVLANNVRAKLNRVLAGLTFSLAAWSVVSFLEDTHISHSAISILVQMDFILSAIMIGLFFWFCAGLTGVKSKIAALVVGSLVVANIVVTLIGQMVQLEFEPHRVKFVDQAGYPAFIVLAIVGLIGGLYLLARRYRHAAGREKAQLLYIYLGLFLMSFLLISTNVVLPNFYNVSPLVTRLGIYSILFFTGLSSYTIVRHRFMDIRLVVARTVAYILLLLTLAGLYGISVFEISRAFFPQNSTSTPQTLVSVALAIVLAFTFQPLRRFFEILTDRIFYRDRYDSQEVLNAVGKVLAEEIKLDRLLNLSLNRICEAINVESAQFMIFEKGKVYKIEHYGPLPEKLMIVSTVQKLRQSILVADELEGGERKEVLDEHGVRVSLMLRTRDEFVGFLFLGDKLSGDIYSNQDLQLLQILAQELSIAIVNAKAYEEIAKFNVTLQERVNQATGRLRVANHNLKALDKAKDEFLSMASHQLRTPLTTIKGYLSMIIEGDAGATTPEQKEFLDYAFDGAQRMVALISDLLNVSRLSAGRFVIEKAPIDLTAVAADEVRQLQTHAATKQIELTFTPPKGKLPLINLDEGKTRQVIMNFVDNAIYYTKAGGVYVSLEGDKTNVYLRVRDTGIGVPEAARKKLFTKFFRAENAQIARPDGTGLGLYLAKRVVEDQGGTIIFESVEGKGSTFGFSMPLKDTAHNHRNHNEKPA